MRWRGQGEGEGRGPGAGVSVGRAAGVGPGVGVSRGRVRPPSVAGQFYSGRAERLAAEVDRYVADARAAMSAAGVPLGAVGARIVAVVAPHAGHMYSGPTAGYAYGVLDPAAVSRVVLLGPAHYVPVEGIGLSTASAWRTPLGDIPLDGEVAADLRAHFDSVVPADHAHAPEHSLEVQLPFLQRVLGDGWALVPLIVGSDLPDELASVIGRVVALPGTLVVVSTDLSHYLDHDSAVARDARTIEAIVGRRAAGIGANDACGRHPLRGLLTAAVANDWAVELLDARNSGDTAGSWDRVVGYAAFAVRAASGAHGIDAADAGSAADPDPIPAPPPAAGSAADPDPAAAHAASRAANPPANPPSPPDPAPGGSRGAGARIRPEHRKVLLSVARRTIEEALTSGRRPRFDVTQWDPELLVPGAAFVTLRSASADLLGCIGSLSAHQPLVQDVAQHAYDAAFRDPRFPPMTHDRAHGMVIDISVLSPRRPFPCTGFADLLARLPVGSGVVVEAGRHRATFLPAVWEQLPEPRAFLAALWRKAGLAPGEWPAGTTIELYDSEEFAEA